MDEQQRLESVSAAFRQFPLLTVLVEGDEQRVVAVSDAVRLLVGDRPIDSPLLEWVDLVGQQVVERYREVYESGEPFVAQDWAIEFVGPDGVPAVVVVDFTIVPARSADGRVTGALGVGQDVGGRPRATVATDLAHRQLVDRDAVAQVQDAVLPKGLPVPQGVELSARYLLADEDGVAGGDWFDAIPLPDGRVVIVVGDVVGHGVEASVVMAELRTLFGERVRLDGDIVAALELLDARARRGRASRAATVCACVVDPDTGELTYCTAGHPPPVLVAAGGEATYLPLSGAGPLASGTPFRVVHRRLREGDLLLLYSNGIVQRPGRTPAQNTVDLLRVVSDAVRGVGPVTIASDESVVERVCRQTLELLTRVTGCADDITLLALQMVPVVEPLELRLPAVPDAVRAARADLGDWLGRLRVSVLESTAILHAVGELVGNAVEHAYPVVDVGNPISVRVLLTPDGLVDLTVHDEGRWRVPTDVAEGRGRGLSLVHGFVDDFDVHHDDGGTRARIRHRLSHPASMLRGIVVDPDQPVRGPELTIVVDGARVTVGGVVGNEGALRLERILERCSRGGVRPIEVDLSEVDLLASAGVRVLLDARAAGEVRLVAPAGSPAQHVLELVQVPYEL